MNKAKSVRFKITALLTVFIMLISVIASIPYTAIDAYAAESLQTPTVSSNGDMVYINGSLPKGNGIDFLTFVVMKAGKDLPKNNEIASLQDMYFFDQTDCGDKDSYSFKFICTAKNTVLKARITSNVTGLSCDFNIEVKENEYKQNLQTVFVDENFENSQGQLKNFTESSANQNLNRVEENGNHYMCIIQDTHGHQIYGFDIPHVDTGKLSITFDTYMSNLAVDDGEGQGNSEVSWWFLGKDVETDRWTQKLMLLGTDWDNEGYGMVGHVDRRNLTLEAQEHYKLSNDDYYDSLCFGKLQTMKWYTYEAEVDIDKRLITAKLYDRDTKVLIGTAKGILGDSNGYYDGMPDSFDTFHLRMSDREVGLDNVKLVYTPQYPNVTAKLKSDHVGNIFTKAELGDAYITLTNKENTEVTVNGKYIIYDDIKNILGESSFLNLTIGANETESIPAELDVDKFGVYYLTAEYTATAENGKSYTHKTDYMDFSVINTAAGSSTNNLLVGGAAHLSTDGFYTFAEDTVKAADKGGFGLMRNPIYMSVQDGPSAPFNEQQLAAKNINKYGLKQMMIVNTVLRRKRKDSDGNYLTDSNGNYLYQRIDVGEANVESATDEEWNELYTWYDRLINDNPLDADYYEIGNEAYYAGVSGSIYAQKMLKPFYERNKAYATANPDKPYIPVIATFGYADVQSWTNDFINAEGLKYCDGVAVHIYDNLSGSNFNDHMRTSEFTKAVNQIKETLKNAGYANVPIYVTETGQSASLKQWKVDIDPLSKLAICDKASRRGQAAMVAESYAFGVSEGFSGIFTHNMMEIGAENPFTEHDPEYYFGLISYGTDTTPYSANPSYVAAAGYNAILGDAEFKDKVITADGTVCMRFEKSDGTDVIICWTDYKAEFEYGMNEFNANSIGLNLGSSEPVQVYDMYTNDIGQLNAVDGVYTISPGYEPMYLVGDFSGLTQAEPKISVTGSGRINMTDRNDMQITLSSADTALLNATTNIETDGDPNIAVRNISKNDGSAEINVRFKAPAVREESIFTTKVYNESGKMIYVGDTYLLAPPDESEQKSYLSAELSVDATSGDIIIDYNNTDLYDEDAVLFIASYKDDRLSNVSASDVKLQTGMGRKNVEVNINCEDADYTRIFLWTKTEYSAIADSIYY